MLTIREIQAADHIGQVMDILRENWAETGFDFELAPDPAIFTRLQEMGILFVLAAFDGEELVGYSSAMVAPHLHNPAIIMCNSDALFVRPAWRSSTAAARLILATELTGRKHGATRMLWHTRAGTPFAATLQKRGYEAADIIVMKRI